jgi:glycosyltransferase involved in cell wall biosynthesis
MSTVNATGLVSIGLPTYNRPAQLRSMMTILTQQTYTDLEIIVSNDNSPDPKVDEVIAEFAGRDSRIRVFKHLINKGVLKNAEFVLKQARGKYFAWVSDDDWRAPEFIEILVKQLESNPKSVVAFCDYREVYEDGNQALGYPPSHLKFFKSFENFSRIKRILSFFWQDALNGKSNIFYGLYTKIELDCVDFNKVSGGFTFLNMDCMIAFTVLQSGPAQITNEMLCTLTCGNPKFYKNQVAFVPPAAGALSKMIEILKNNFVDGRRYILNTNSWTERTLIAGAIIFRSFNQMLHRKIKKIKSKNDQLGSPLRG